jgi:hypothetical protein
MVALLAACAGQAPVHPQMTATQEAQKYRAHAHASYVPPGPPSDPWGPYIVEAAHRFDVPDTWIREVMRVESGGYQFRATGELTTSPVGAMGLMQLMPETYDEMRGRYSLGDDAYDPHNNILAGAAYMREMYDAFGSPGFLAAYNAGPARLEDYLTRNRPLPDETRRYVWMIGSRIGGTYPSSRSPAEMLAVNQIPIDIPAGPRWHRHTTYAIASRDRRRHGEAIQVAVVDRRAHRGSTIPVEVAEAPEPRHGHAASPQPIRVAVATPVGHHASGGGFHIIAPAMAADFRPVGHAGQAHLWGVQVGAYSSREQAAAAAKAAHGVAHEASPAVAAAEKGHAKVYRARLSGLTHDGAVAACHKLSHKGNCLVVTPASR